MRAYNGQVEELIHGCLQEMGFSASEVRPDQRLEEDLGLDSIEVVELVAMVLKRAGLPAGTVMPAQTPTISDLAVQVRQASPPPIAKAG